jgi:hypothetical protein
MRFAHGGWTSANVAGRARFSEWDILLDRFAAIAEGRPVPDVPAHVLGGGGDHWRQSMSAGVKVRDNREKRQSTLTSTGSSRASRLRRHPDYQELTRR